MVLYCGIWCLSDAALEEMLADCGDAVEAREFLAAKGYMWWKVPDSPSRTPDFPNLMDCMFERIPVS